MVKNLCILFRWYKNVLMKISTTFLDLTIVPGYAPTTTNGDETIKNLLQSVKKQQPWIIIGDLDVKFRMGRDGNIIGDHGLGETNE